VCQRQTREEKTVAEIDRKAEAGDTWARKEAGGGGSARLIALAVLLGCMDEICALRGRGWRACWYCQPWEQGQHDVGSADRFVLKSSTLLSPWPRLPATSSLAEDISARECRRRRRRNNWSATEASKPTDLWGAEPSKRHSQMVSSHVPVFIDVLIRWHSHESRRICAFQGLSGTSMAW